MFARSLIRTFLRRSPSPSLRMTFGLQNISSSNSTKIPRSVPILLLGGVGVLAAMFRKQLRSVALGNNQLSNFTLSLPQQSSSHPEELVSSGIEYHNNQQYKQAIDCFDRALKVYPNSANVHYCRAISLYQLQNNEQALEAFENALACDKNLAEAHSGRAGALYRLGAFEHAIEAAERALLIDSKLEGAHFNRALASSAIGNDHKAIESYSFVLTSDPSNSEALFNRALLLSRNGLHQMAVEDLKHLAKLNPQDSDVQEMLYAELDLLFKNMVA